MMPNKKAIWFLLPLLMLLHSGMSALADGEVPNRRKPRPESVRNAAIIEFKGEIDWQLSKYFRSRLSQARAAGVDLLVIEIDSPGGLKTESLDIAEQLRDIDWAYTVALIPRQAISGAALISLGCDEWIVAPEARIGDIGIIAFDPELFAFRFAPAKIQSVLVRQARDLASSKGRPPQLAESMIDKDVMTYRKPVGDRWEYRNIRVDSNDIPIGPWELIEESGAERFLTVSGQRARELELADEFARDRKSMAELFDLEESDFRVHKRTSTDTIVYYLNHPFGTGLLIVVGLVALYFELAAPGIGAGGLVAGLCATLFFWSRFLGGTSTWLEIVLFVAGLTFLFAEIFVIPGWGVSGIIGLGLIICSVFMASQEFVVPQSPRQWNQFLTTALIYSLAGVSFLVGAVFITRRIGSIPGLSRLVLTPETGESDTETGVDEKTGKPIPQPHPVVSVGDWGRAESQLRPAGRASFAGRSFDVVSDGTFIEPETQVKVVDIQGNRIMVVAIEEDHLTDTVYHNPKKPSGNDPSVDVPGDNAGNS